MTAKPSLKMQEALVMIFSGSGIQWNTVFEDSVDFHSATVAALLKRGYAVTQQGTAYLALTEEGKKSAEEAAKTVVLKRWQQKKVVENE